MTTDWTDWTDFDTRLIIRYIRIIRVRSNSFSPAKVLLFPDIRKFMNYIYQFSLGFSFGIYRDKIFIYPYNPLDPCSFLKKFYMF